jgi:hypothetical protein
MMQNLIDQPLRIPVRGVAEQLPDIQRGQHVIKQALNGQRARGAGGLEQSAQLFDPLAHKRRQDLSRLVGLRGTRVDDDREEAEPGPCGDALFQIGRPGKKVRPQFAGDPDGGLAAEAAEVTSTRTFSAVRQRR